MIDGVKQISSPDSTYWRSRYESARAGWRQLMKSA
jgi:hypothetical protein